MGRGIRGEGGDILFHDREWIEFACNHGQRGYRNGRFDVLGNGKKLLVVMVHFVRREHLVAGYVQGGEQGGGARR